MNHFRAVVYIRFGSQQGAIQPHSYSPKQLSKSILLRTYFHIPLQLDLSQFDTIVLYLCNNLGSTFPIQINLTRHHERTIRFLHHFVHRTNVPNIISYNMYRASPPTICPYIKEKRSTLTASQGRKQWWQDTGEKMMNEKTYIHFVPSLFGSFISNAKSSSALEHIFDGQILSAENYILPTSDLKNNYVLRDICLFFRRFCIQNPCFDRRICSLQCRATDFKRPIWILICLGLKNRRKSGSRNE